MTMEEITFTLTKEFIELNKLLKFVGAVNSGAESGILISEGIVMVNKEIELRKRRKMRKGDVVNVENIQILVI